MQILPVDLVALISSILGISIVLIPVMGITARFALKPTVEALGRMFEHRGLEETVQILERRMSLMEQQVESMETSVRRLSEAHDFDRALGSGRAADAREGRSRGS